MYMYLPFYLVQSSISLLFLISASLDSNFTNTAADKGSINGLVFVIPCMHMKNSLDLFHIDQRMKNRAWVCAGLMSGSYYAICRI